MYFKNVLGTKIPMPLEIKMVLNLAPNVFAFTALAPILTQIPVSPHPKLNPNGYHEHDTNAKPN